MQVEGCNISPSLTKSSCFLWNSVHKWESLLELYSDAHMFGLKSANSKAVKNSNLAISWLEATFPELTQKEVHAENAAVLRAQPYALFDASISLQSMPHVNIHEYELSDCPS
ncbi:hypothetical protein K7X08_012343 [Anisodus acutangulus]|uniref:Uncharacterized protein n=1 Tax=Anisodus acutangulus TaxID=402998 RepID=A0A9Q1LDX7_9SOLA|nr:hypothetical protein K7X08_012343 [Anisodus acutangulus]